MYRLMRSGVLAAGLLVWQAVALAHSPARAEEFGGNDLRDIRLGMAATELAESGYVDFHCAADSKRTLSGWKDWRDCPADASGTRAIRFGYDPTTSRDGTMVAGHPAILTLLIDDTAHVAGLQIETDPRARLYIRKKVGHAAKVSPKQETSRWVASTSGSAAPRRSAAVRSLSNAICSAGPIRTSRVSSMKRGSAYCAPGTRA
jgi:hypothetical protein